MLNTKKVEQIAKQITESLPPGVRQVAEGVESKVKQVLQHKLGQLDFVSREEFDIQTQVLARTREKVEQLEQQLTDLEEKFNTKES